MLTTLTEDQWQAVDACREDTIRRVLHDPPTVEDLREAATACYATIGEPPPAVVVAPGPLTALAWSAMLCPDGQLGGQLWNQLGDQLWNQLRGQLEVQLGGQLRGQLEGQLRGQLGDQLRGQLEVQLRDQLGGQLEDQLGGQLGGQFRGQLEDQLGGQLGGQLEVQLEVQLWGQLEDQLEVQLGGQLEDQFRRQFKDVMWSGWNHAWLTHWLHVAGIDGIEPPSDDVLDLARHWHTLTRPTFTIPLKGVLIVCGHHDTCRRDRDGRLHATDGPAWSWPDGTEVWALDGIRLPSWAVTDPDPARILADLPNTEQRRVALARYGWARAVGALGCEQIDQSDDPHLGTLWTLPDSVSGGQARLLIARNASPHLDGTWADYGLLVDSRCSTVTEAQAWLAGLDVDQWAALDGAS